MFESSDHKTRDLEAAVLEATEAPLCYHLVQVMRDEEEIVSAGS